MFSACTFVFSGMAFTFKYIRDSTGNITCYINTDISANDCIQNALDFDDNEFGNIGEARVLMIVLLLS